MSLSLSLSDSFKSALLFVLLRHLLPFEDFVPSKRSGLFIVYIYNLLIYFYFFVPLGTGEVGGEGSSVSSGVVTTTDTSSSRLLSDSLSVPVNPFFVNRNNLIPF